MNARTSHSQDNLNTPHLVHAQFSSIQSTRVLRTNFLLPQHKYPMFNYPSIQAKHRVKCPALRLPRLFQVYSTRIQIGWYLLSNSFGSTNQGVGSVFLPSIQADERGIAPALGLQRRSIQASKQIAESPLQLSDCHDYSKSYSTRIQIGWYLLSNSFGSTTQGVGSVFLTSIHADHEGVTPALGLQRRTIQASKQIAESPLQLSDCQDSSKSAPQGSKSVGIFYPTHSDHQNRE